MSGTRLKVVSAGPHVSIQDGGRSGFARFGVPRSGPMDRLAFAAANLAIGNPHDLAGVEVSLGGLVLECLDGAIGFAVAGGDFVIDLNGQRHPAWSGGTLRRGQRLAIRPGHWGSWCYLALAGQIRAEEWLGSLSTHAPSGFGGGRLVAGDDLRVTETRSGSGVFSFPRPVFARPRTRVHVTMGPQERFFSADPIESFLGGVFRLGSAYDRMGVRLRGPLLMPDKPLDMPSGPVVRGAVQVAGDGVATVLLADHQTTGGYPRIATVLDAELDAFVQLRPNDQLAFSAVSARRAHELARTRRLAVSRWLDRLSVARCGNDNRG